MHNGVFHPHTLHSGPSSAETEVAVSSGDHRRASFE